MPLRTEFAEGIWPRSPSATRTDRTAGAEAHRESGIHRYADDSRTRSVHSPRGSRPARFLLLGSTRVFAAPATRVPQPLPAPPPESAGAHAGRCEKARYILLAFCCSMPKCDSDRFLTRRLMMRSSKLDPVVRTILEAMEADGRPPLETLPVADARQGAEAMRV